MSSRPTDFALILSAASFAAERHRDQRREDADATPYINHPLQVANILAEASVCDPDVLAAALLPDTIEDTETTSDEIAERFGPRVESLVREVTDDKSLPKTMRKRRQIEGGPTKSDGAKMIKVADKIANLQDLEESPPDWTPEQIEAYRAFAVCVMRACEGTNATLDDRARHCMRSAL